MLESMRGCRAARDGVGRHEGVLESMRGCWEA